MGFNSKTASKRQRATDLRLAGHSYGQILKELNIPSKGTLSQWFRELDLPAASKKKLEHNVRVSYERGLQAFNQRRSQKIVQENQNSRKAGDKLMGKLNQRDLLIAGVALYWGEGTKSLNGGRYPAIAFSNSDPGIIALFMRFVREVLHVSEHKIHGGIHLYAKTDQVEARKFWAQVTGLSPQIFYISLQVSRASQGRRKWNRLPHGTLSIRISNRRLFYQILGMIDGLAKNIKK